MDCRHRVIKFSLLDSMNNSKDVQETSPAVWLADDSHVIVISFSRLEVL